MSDWERGRTQNREIATLRKRYAEHRDAISRLIADAPTERLAKSYEGVRSEIDAAIAKIEEIDGAATGPIGLKPPAVAAEAGPSTRRVASAARGPLTASTR